MKMILSIGLTMIMLLLIMILESCFGQIEKIIKTKKKKIIGMTFLFNFLTFS